RAMERARAAQPQPVRPRLGDEREDPGLEGMRGQLGSETAHRALPELRGEAHGVLRFSAFLRVSKAPYPHRAATALREYTVCGALPQARTGSIGATPLHPDAASEEPSPPTENPRFGSGSRPDSADFPSRNSGAVRRCAAVSAGAAPQGSDLDLSTI